MDSHYVVPSYSSINPELTLTSQTYQMEDVGKSAFQAVRNYCTITLPEAPYLIVFSFALGLFFAPWSTGLFLIVLFLIIFELLVGMIIQEITIEYLAIRLAIVASYFLGWLLGRIVIGDCRPIRPFFSDNLENMGRPHFCHPALRKRKVRKPAISSRISLGEDLHDEHGICYVKDRLIKPDESKDARKTPDYTYPNIFSLFQWAEEEEEWVEPFIPKADSKSLKRATNSIIRNCHFRSISQLNHNSSDVASILKYRSSNINSQIL